MSAAPMVISQPEPGHWTVAVGQAYCDHLTWDEMVSQVCSLTHPSINAPRYSMLTAAEHAERRRRMEERVAMRAEFAAEDEARRSAIGAMADALRQWQVAERRGDGQEFANAQAARDAALERANVVGLA